MIEKTSSADQPLQRAEARLLVDAPDGPACLLGNEALVRGALEAGVNFACGYPGTPSSEVTDGFARLAEARGIGFEYSVNEKVALEMAFAASLAGARSICAMKHLGLMVAGDPLSTIPYVGTVGGMVIVSAGDPSCHTSPNEQDQRHLGPMLHIPVLDPSTPQEALEMTKGAFSLSERCRLPVLLRITARVAHTSAAVRMGRLTRRSPTGFVRDPQRFVPIPAHARRLRSELTERMAAARHWLQRAQLFRPDGNGRLAILAAGSPAATCADLLDDLGLQGQLGLATLGAVHPLPEEELVAWLSRRERVLVVEELSPFVEDAVRALCTRHGLATEVLGKRTGHLPEAFEYEPETIQRGLHDALGLGRLPEVRRQIESPPPRPPVLCAGCPHRSTYFAARSAFGPEQLYFNDIGCYTLGLDAPLNTADALLCMGAGFTLAAGVSRVTGQRTVGFLGDSTFFHAGMPALLNAIQTGANMVAVILDNQVTAMTGFQQSPTTEGADGSEGGASIEGVVRALGARQVRCVDPMDLQATIRAFERARDERGLSVVIARHACPVHEARGKDAPEQALPYAIDPTRCQTCGRECADMRCSQDTSEGLQRSLARSRALFEPEARAEPGPPVAPCSTRCPLGLCVQGYTGHVASGQMAQALELILSRCPLPDSVCRVCHRPCEDACVHAGSGQPVAINDLKRFVMDWAAAQPGQPYDPPRDAEHGRRVAVVGAGPAGLAAAHDLRLRGYQVTLFDAAEEPGGLLRHGIPGFRLPAEAARRDVQRILDLGVAFEGGRRLGADLQLEELLANGFDAVFLAVGAHHPRSLTVPGAGDEGAPALVEALGYLRDAAAGRPLPTGGCVAVIGGGNAALDAARVALRQGAGEVSVVYRRGREDMPALPDEITGAEQEGVTLLPDRMPLALQGGARPGLRCARTEPGPPAGDGRPVPRVVQGSEQLLPVDLVLLAVGQDPDPALGDGLDLDTDASGCLLVDPVTGATSHERVFAGGDAAGSARTVTDAIADGQRAAWGLDATLRGQEDADRRPPPPSDRSWPAAAGLRARPPSRLPPEVRRQRPHELPPDERSRQHAAEVVGTLSDHQARAEASRCSLCGQCGNCRACIDVLGCPAFYLEQGRVQIDPRLCNGCGVCADLCPTGAIAPVSGEAS